MSLLALFSTLHNFILTLTQPLFYVIFTSFIHFIHFVAVHCGAEVQYYGIHISSTDAFVT